MRAEEREPAHLWDMLQYAREAARLVEGVSRKRLRCQKIV